MLNALVHRSLDRASENLHSLYQNRLRWLRKIKPRFEVYCEVGPFILKTVSNRAELMQALQLRYEVFHRELAGKTRASGIDVDAFDFQCDHLIIIDKKTEKVVGAFRLYCSRFGNVFYAAREFNLTPLTNQQKTMLELGRACIHKDYRRGMASSLLWRGVAEYMVRSGSEIVFGCTSFKTEDPRKAALLYRFLIQEEKVSKDCLMQTHLCFALPGFESQLRSGSMNLTESEIHEAEAMIPFVCRGYLKSGATIVSKPAWDAEFKCIDLLTILRRDDLNRTLWK